MASFKGLIDVVTLGSERPLRRLLAYYLLLGIIIFGVLRAVPAVEEFAGVWVDRRAEEEAVMLPDGLRGAAPDGTPAAVPVISQLRLVLETTATMLAALALMLPVSWVYMSARKSRGYDQTVAQTLIILPLVVTGIILVVHDSLALAFSLAGVVAAVRFRTTLEDTRDVVFVFLAIAVGFAAGVQAIAVGFVLSVLFNVVLVLAWHYDYGRNPLEPSANAQWTAPLAELSEKGDAAIPDRDLALALTPKKAGELAERFDRVSTMLGSKQGKPQYNGILTITAADIGKAQKSVERVLENETKRWKLDAVEKNEGKPSTLFFLVRLRKSSTDTNLMTAVRTGAGDCIADASLELSGSAGTAGKN